MKALSIRQPWASLIVLGIKDIENRTWMTRERGTILVHASKGMTRDEHESAIEFAVDAIRADPRNVGKTKTRTLREMGFAFDALHRGGIVGQVDIVDCVSHSNSPWYLGGIGFVLANAKPLPFRPLKGALGFFKVPEQPE
jgi:hypothetical protein